MRNLDQSIKSDMEKLKKDVEVMQSEAEMKTTREL